MSFWLRKTVPRLTVYHGPGKRLWFGSPAIHLTLVRKKFAFRGLESFAPIQLRPWPWGQKGRSFVPGRLSWLMSYGP